MSLTMPVVRIPSPRLPVSHIPAPRIPGPRIQLPFDLPHQYIGKWLNDKFDEHVKSKFFRGMSFDDPVGDPGWFGPDSATWYVHSHTPALIFGLQCASYMERLDPSIFWMGMHHSRLVAKTPVHGSGRIETMGRIDPAGANVRLGHSLAFFIGTAYGTTDTAERLARTVRAMHHTIKGVRPDGLPYDADDPHWLRWNYATVVWGIATAHEIYHPRPLRGDDLDRYYGEFVRVGHALGGTDLPATKAETLECLEGYLPRLALNPRQRDGHRRQSHQTRSGRGRLGHPRHHAVVGRPAGSVPATKPGGTTSPAQCGVECDQRSAREYG